MLFSWDEKKRQENWRLRQVDFIEAAGIFEDSQLIEVIDNRKDYGETRIRAFGKFDGVFYLVVYTWRGDTRHIITAWKAGKDGKKRYQDLFKRRPQSDEGEG